MAEEPGVPRQRIHQRVRARVVNRWQKTLESERMTNVLIAILVVGMGALLIGIAFMALNPQPLSMRDRVNQLSAAATISAAFACEGGKSIIAAFTNGEVRISLSDTRQVYLPEVASPTGAMYANPDKSFIFYNESNRAEILEFGKKTYSNCVAN